MRVALYNQVKAIRALPTATRTANEAVNGDTIDLAGSNTNYRTVLFVISTGTITDGSNAVIAEDSANGSSWAAVSAGSILGTLPTIVAANDDTFYEIGVQPTRRYVRLVVTTTGATVGGTFGAIALLGQPSMTPVSR